MSRVKTMLGVVILIAFAIVGIGFADHEEKREHGKHRKGHNGEEKRSSESDDETLKSVSNAVYKEKCGACHFAYQPELLVSEGWKQILERSDNHFGESVDLNAEEKKEIESYLLTNAADKSGSEIARKIVKNLDRQSPMRISKNPYIIKKHREVKPIIVKGETTGSLSNCSACHKRAEAGYYDDDADE